MALAPVRLTLAAATAVVAVGAGFTNVAPVAARRARPLLPRRWPDDRWRLRVARANDLSSGRDEERAYDECDPILTDTIGFGSDDDVVCSIENPYLETINEMDAEPSSAKNVLTVREILECSSRLVATMGTTRSFGCSVPSPSHLP